MQRQSFWNLPEEMVLEILSWLPAKSVGQCRCVSKSWRALLSQPEFIQTHLERSRILTHESLVLCDPMRSLYSALLSDAHQGSDKITFFATKLSFANCLRGSLKSVRASCDGLVLVGDYDGWSWVMNPITREIKEVPPFPFTPSANVAWQLYGFGYDSASHDYKIVVVYDEANVTFVCVYSLKTGSWKNVGNSLYSRVIDKDSGVFINGCIHWYDTRTIDKKHIIVTFDLLEEKFGELLLPKSCGFTTNKLGVLGGCLSIYDASTKSVWAMKEYSVAESWSRIIIDDDHGCYSPCFLGDEQVVMCKDGKYFIYNMKQGTSMDIAINDKSERYNSQGFIIEGSFRESLVSPHAP